MARIGLRDRVRIDTKSPPIEGEFEEAAEAEREAEAELPEEAKNRQLPESHQTTRAR
ncbi:MAG TPA: hypothetical protein VJR29_03070 [bacterium]|nr:hypothetical protein [bacterium]